MFKYRSKLKCRRYNGSVVVRSTLLVIRSLSTALCWTLSNNRRLTWNSRGLHRGPSGYRFTRLLIANRSVVWFSGIIGETICQRSVLERASPWDSLLPPPPPPMYRELQFKFDNKVFRYSTPPASRISLVRESRISVNGIIRTGRRSVLSSFFFVFSP